MKKVNSSTTSKNQVMGLTTLSKDELKNVYGGADIYFVQTITKDGKIIWELVIK